MINNYLSNVQMSEIFKNNWLVFIYIIIPINIPKIIYVIILKTVFSFLYVLTSCKTLPKC